MTLTTQLTYYLHIYAYLHFHISTDYLGDSSLVLTHPMTSRKTCKVSVQEFHRKTNQSFDLDFIRKESFFVLNNLKATLDVPKSVDFLKSIRILGNKIKKKDFLQLFPELIDYYRSEDFLKKKLGDYFIDYFSYCFILFSFIFQFVFCSDHWSVFNYLFYCLFVLFLIFHFLHFVSI